MFQFIHYFIIPYLFISFIFFIFDIQQIKNTRLGSGIFPTINKYKNCLSNILLNLFIIAVLPEYIFYKTNFNNNCSLFILIISIITSILCADIWFYTFHRLFHSNKYLYKKIHSIHHKYTEPFALAAIDCHYIEHIIINIGSVIIGPLVLLHFGILSLKFIKLFSVLVSISSTTSHSGYKIFSKYHFNHHLYLTSNYGIISNFSDRLCGTLR